MYDYVQDQGHAWIPCFLDRRHLRGRTGPPAHPARVRGTVRGTGTGPRDAVDERREIRVDDRRTGPPRQHPVAAARPRSSDRTFGAAPEQGLTRGDVHRFSLVGVIWDDPDTALHGSVQVRTRATATGTWSGWQDVDTHNDDHGADPGTAERTSGHVRGSTAPLWVGDSDGVDVRVRADRVATRTVGKADDRPSQLPTGLHLELVDPGAAAPARGRTGDQEPSRHRPRGRHRTPGPDQAGDRTGTGRPGPQGAAVHRAAPARASSPGTAGAPTSSWGEGVRVHEAGQGGFRAPHRHGQQLPLLASAFSHSRYLPLPRREQRLA